MEPAKLVADSATAKMIAGAVSSADIVSNGTTASHWFPFVFVGSNRDVILVEEAISLGRFGALTLLSLAP